ncbi:tetratricopeptide repeat protein, partial [Myxococcota bacterium]
MPGPAPSWKASGEHHEPNAILLKKTLIAVAVLLGAGSLAYSNSFSGPFVFDGIAAVRDFTLTIQLRPRDHQAYNNRGASLYFKKQYDQAIGDFNQALKMGLKETRVYLNLGKAHLAKNDPGQAIAAFDEALRLDPKNAEIYNHRGMAYGKMKDHHRAIHDFTKAIGLDPEYAKQGRHHQAADAFAGA